MISSAYLFPRRLLLSIGSDRSPNVVDTTDRWLVDVLKLDGFTQDGMIFGCVYNHGDGAFTVDVDSSSDNGNTDAWADVTCRVNGSDETSWSVAAGGFVDFAIERAAFFAADTFLRVQATPASVSVPPKGLFAMVYLRGNVSIFSRTYAGA